MKNTWDEHSGSALSSCDKEPIHLLGKIQSIGHLIAVSSSNLSIQYASDGIETVFGCTPEILYGKRLELFFDENLLQAVTIFSRDKKNYYSYEKVVNMNGSFYQIFFSKSKDYILLEFERVEDIGTFYYEVSIGFRFIDEFLYALEASDSEEKLAANTAVLLRHYTGFDRVMVYKFDKEGHGSVIAEDKKLGLESFLGLHYPASDIPRQARILYLTNKVRAINHVDDPGKPILNTRNASAEGLLDLSYSLFRSVSPVHIEYLKNMGVASTHAISLVFNNELWGMLICHHYAGARFLPMHRRLQTQIIGDLFSNRIAVLQSKTQEHKNVLLRRLLESLSYKGSSLTEVLQTSWNDIANLLSCDGLYCKTSTSEIMLGDVPIAQQITTIDAVLRKLKESVAHTNSLYTLGINTHELSIAGAMRLELSYDGENVVLLFRKEILRTVYWAGNPEKPMEISPDAQQRLSPRKSFAAWKEQHQFMSSEWEQHDIQMATIIRDALIAFQIEQLSRQFNDNKALESTALQLQELLRRRTADLEKVMQQLQEQIAVKDQVQKQLYASKIAAEHMSSMKTELLTTLGSELQEPLRRLAGLAGTLKENSIPLEQSEIQQVAAQQLERTEELLRSINKVLDVARIETNSYVGTFSIINIAQILQQPLQLLRMRAAKKKIAFTSVLHQQELEVITEGTIIEQVISSLAANAIHQSPEYGRVEINIKLILDGGDDILMITIEDSGDGIIPPNVLSAPAFLAANTTNTIHLEHPLELYVVKNYVEYLKGTISIEAEPGRGTQFVVKIPVTIA